MKYRDYEKANHAGRTDAEIENAVDGLFGADAEMGDPIEQTSTYTKYNFGGYMFYCNHSTFDTVAHVDDDGTVIEEWSLDY